LSRFDPNVVDSSWCGPFPPQIVCQGHDEAAAHIALFHLAGLHFPQSASEAETILQTRAEAGCAPSYFWQGFIQMNGIQAALREADLLQFLHLDDDALTEEDFSSAFNPDGTAFAKTADHTKESFVLVYEAAVRGFHRAHKALADFFANWTRSTNGNLVLNQLIDWARTYSESNPLEQLNINKAHGTNGEIDKAIELLCAENQDDIDHVQVKRLLQSAANKGYAKAMYLLHLTHPLKSSASFKNHFDLQAAVRGCPNGQYEFGLLLYNHPLFSSDYSLAAQWFQLAAAQGQIDSQFYLGRMYDKGQHFEKDSKKAAGLYMKAAQGGQIVAQAGIGLFYTSGHGLPQSHNNAAKWCTKVINTPFDATKDVKKLLDPRQRQFHTMAVNSANFSLGKMYLFGHHFPKSYPTALKHFTLGAEGGDMECQSFLGSLLTKDNPHSQLPNHLKNTEASLKWYTMAAEQGDASSQCTLAAHLFDGKDGVKHDVVAAVSWWRKAAQKEFPLAQFELGRLHYDAPHPHIVPKDTKESIRLLTLAAQQGFVDAQIKLGEIHEQAHNNPLAEKWYTLAASLGNPEGSTMLALFYDENLDYLPPNLTQKQRDAKIVSLYSTAAAAGDLSAKFRLGMLLLDLEGDRSTLADPIRAINLFADVINSSPDVQTDQNSVVAPTCYYLGHCAGARLSDLLGIKTTLCFTTPLQWWTFGAKHGDRKCQYELANLYYEGQGGVKQDFALASYWLDKSINQGDTDAAALLGKMQHRGVFVPPPESDDE
jgi:TPR repeat protein